ncbi:zinc ribbon domain-containing protein [Paucilactobacillus kaifaensis]|uniref:zinc ribbon domain-containing protein n=1 Tax=Paucilactobacillus kaifaensis TaxID=2559921 RepID=UPI0010F597EF|nr:zinc ribbon domain-containing protein [Paucilactobacillus kaifaensis]
MDHKAKFCPNCCKQLSNEPEFCPFCGYNLKEYWQAYDQNKQVRNESRTTGKDSNNDLEQTNFPSQQRPPKKSKRKRSIIIAIIIVLLLVLVFFVWHSVSGGTVDTATNKENSVSTNKTKHKRKSTKKDDSSSANSSVATSSSSPKNQLNASSLTPNQTAAAIAYYADAHGYWSFNFTTENYLQAFEEITNDDWNLTAPGDDNVQYDIQMADTGSGGVYFYTLNGGTNVNIYEFDDFDDENHIVPQKTASLSEIVAYINDVNAVDEVNSIANNATIEDDR